MYRGVDTSIKCSRSDLTRIVHELARALTWLLMPRENFIQSSVIIDTPVLIKGCNPSSALWHVKPTGAPQAQSVFQRKAFSGIKRRHCNTLVYTDHVARGRIAEE